MANGTTQPEAPERIFISPKKAIALADVFGDTVHTMYQSGAMFLGADHDIKSLKKRLESAEKIEIGGENSMKMGHGIVVWDKNVKVQSDLLFVQHNKKRMEKFLKTRK